MGLSLLQHQGGSTRLNVRQCIHTHIVHMFSGCSAMPHAHVGLQLFVSVEWLIQLLVSVAAELALIEVKARRDCYDNVVCLPASF